MEGIRVKESLMESHLLIKRNKEGGEELVRVFTKTGKKKKKKGKQNNAVREI